MSEEDEIFSPAAETVRSGLRLPESDSENSMQDRESNINKTSKKNGENSPFNNFSESDNEGAEEFMNRKKRKAHAIGKATAKKQKIDKSNSDYEPFASEGKSQKITLHKNISKASSGIDSESKSSLSDSDEELLSELKGKQSSAPAEKEAENDSDKEALNSKVSERVAEGRSAPKASSAIKKNSGNESDSSASDSEGEPLSIFKGQTRPVKEKEGKMSDSDYEPIASKKKPQRAAARRSASKVSLALNKNSGNSSDSSIDDSDGEPLSTLKGKQMKTWKKKQKEMSDSDFEPSATKKKFQKGPIRKRNSKASSVLNKNSGNISGSSESDSDGEPLSILKGKQTKQSKKKGEKMSDSEDEPLNKKPPKIAARKRTSKASSAVDKSGNISGSSESDSEGEPLSILRGKQTKQSKKEGEKMSDSEDEPLNKKPLKIAARKMTSKSSSAIDKSGNISGSSKSDSDGEPLSILKGKQTKPSKKKVEKMSDSEDEPLNKKASKIAALQRTSKASSTVDKSGSISGSESDSDGEPLSVLKGKQTKPSKKEGEKVRDSEDEPLNKKSSKIAALQRTSKASSAVDKSGSVFGSSESDSDGEPLSVLKGKQTKPPKKKGEKMRDSENEPFNKKAPKIASRKRTSKASSVIKKSGKISGSSESDSDGEPLSILKGKQTKPSKKKVEEISDSEDEPLSKKPPKIAVHERVSKASSAVDKSGNISGSSESDSDVEPLSVLKGKQTKPSNKCKDDISESDDEPLIKANDKSSKTSSADKKFGSDVENYSSSVSENSDKILANTAKKQAVKKNNMKNSEKIKKTITDSDEEPLQKKGKSSKSSSSNKTINLNSKNTKLRSDDESCSSSASDSSDEVLSNLAKKKQSSKGKNNEKSKKSTNSTSNKIENMKKYVRAAGIHIQSYPKLFEDCKSEKSKVEKLKALLEKEGLKGRPTLEKCKKLKKKIETKKEISELDVTNIISSKGRSKRNSFDSVASSKFGNESTPPKQRFSRLQDIIDSEESD